MKKIILPVVAMALISCGSPAEKGEETKGHGSAEAEQAAPKSLVEHEVFSIYNPEATSIGFGAFKTTDKAEVKGWFNEFEISGVEENDSVHVAFANASISIDVASLETNDPTRNQNVLNGFFSKTTSSQKIQGKVVSIDADNGKAVLELDFNDVKKELSFNYDLSADTLYLTGVLNLEDVNGLEALSSINEICKNLHKGADGVSKTWSDVNIYITTVVNRK